MATVHIPNIDAAGNFLNPQVLNRLAERFGGAGPARTALAARLVGHRYRDTNTTDAPTTLTAGTTAVLTPRVTLDFGSMTTHPAGQTNTTFNRIDNGLQPLEFYYDGDELELMLAITNGFGVDTDIWVDDQPLSATPLNTPSHTTNATGYLYLKWTTARRRKLRFLNFGASLRGLFAPNYQSSIYPVGATPTVGIITDSFGAQTAYTTNFQALPARIEKCLNVNLLRSTIGGSGYISGGQINQPYAHASRRGLLGASALDALVFFGSINDPTDRSETETRAAFRNTWDAYATDHPGVPFVVFGPQPSGGDRINDAGRARNNRLMYLEAQAHRQVVGYVDLHGNALTGTAPPAWDAVTTYQPGDLVHRLGAIYRCAIPAGQTLSGNWPPNTSHVHWQRVSWVFTGTGNAGATKSDGNRDHLLGADGVHPTPAGSYAFGRLMSDALVKVLASTQGFTYYRL